MEFKTSRQTWLVSCAIAITVLLISSFITIPSYAQKLHTEDYAITDFGLKNGNTPFVNVQGKAGGSYDASVGDEGYQAYVFKTDKGNFMITVSEGSDTNLDTESGRGKPSFQDHTAEYLGHNLNLTAITHVYAIQVTLDDPDDECETGEHVSKIYSQMTK